MFQIIVQNLGVVIGERLFQNVNFTFSESERIGIVGNNGVGKSTLLQCIAGQVEPTEGRIVKPKLLRIGFVGQTTDPALAELTLRQAILESIPAEERLLSEWRVDLLLDSFDAPEEMRERKLSQLSGGWQQLAMIARVWLTDPDVLILDEPTNHLDLRKIILLENWLTQELAKVPLLMVSHDRRFLDVCTNHTLFLRSEESWIYSYSFSKARELLQEDDKTLQNKKEKEIKEIQRLKKTAHNLRQIGVNNYSDAALRKSIQIAKRAESIQVSLPAVHVEIKRDIKLGSRDTHAKQVIEIENLMVKSPSESDLFHINQLFVNKGDRIVILGRNGTGKTQFVKKLRAGFADYDAARSEGLSIAPSVIMGYIDQNMSQISDNYNLREYLNRAHGVTEQQSISLLISAGFPMSHHSKLISLLSPGQKARLGLLAIRLLEPSFYLMDEPTNHLDIIGQEQLEAEILNHETTSIMVSHDRKFVENIGNRFLVIKNHQLIEIDSPEFFYNDLTKDD